MSKKEQEIIDLIQERTPDGHEQWAAREARDSIVRDIRAIRDAHSEYGNSDCSRTHAPGPFEVNVSFDNSEVEDRIGELKNHFESLEAASEAEVEALQEQTAALQEAAADQLAAQEEANEQLDYIADELSELPGIRLSLDRLNDIAMANLGLTAITSFVHACQMEELTDHVDAWGEEIRDAIEEAEEEICEKLDEVDEHICDTIAEESVNIRNAITEEGEETRQTIVTESRNAQNTAIKVGRRICDTVIMYAEEEILQLAAIRQEQVQASAILKQQMDSVRAAVAVMNQDQERRHRETLATLQRLASSRLAIEAEERYGTAQRAFQVGRIRDAVRELAKCFEANRSHARAWLLFGECCFRRAETKKAKNAFHAAGKYAELDNDVRTRTEAAIRLARLEVLVGNAAQALSILRESEKEIPTQEFKDKIGLERLLLECRLAADEHGLPPDDECRRVGFEFVEICSRDRAEPTAQALLTDPTFDPLRTCLHRAHDDRVCWLVTNFKYCLDAQDYIDADPIVMDADTDGDTIDDVYRVQRRLEREFESMVRIVEQFGRFLFLNMTHAEWHAFEQQDPKAAVRLMIVTGQFQHIGNFLRTPDGKQTATRRKLVRLLKRNLPKLEKAFQTVWTFLGNR